MRLRRIGSGTILVLALTLPGPLDAQTTLGIRVGPGISTFSGEGVEEDEVDAMIGFNVGARVDIPVVSALGLSSGVYFMRKGGTIRGDIGDLFPGLDIAIGGGNASVEVQLAYVELPLMLQATAPSGWPVGASLYGGGLVGYNITCDALFEQAVIAFERECVSEIARAEYGARFGGGLSFRVRERMIAWLDAGMDLGLSSNEVAGSQRDVTNRVYYLSLGVSWPTAGR